MLIWRGQCLGQICRIFTTVPIGKCRARLTLVVCTSSSCTVSSTKSPHALLFPFVQEDRGHYTSIGNIDDDVEVHNQQQDSGSSSAASGDKAVGSADQSDNIPRLLPMQLRTDNVNRISYFIMSMLVAIFINLPFGKSHVRAFQFLVPSAPPSHNCNFRRAAQPPFDPTGNPKPTDWQHYIDLARSCPRDNLFNEQEGRPTILI